jgi:antitoxin ParD1/3/4
MMTMARTVTVTLGPHYEEFIQAGIASGKYNNVSEMIRAALRHLEEDEAKLAAFCAAIDEGDASPDVVDFDEEAFIAEMKEGWRVKNG